MASQAKCEKCQVRFHIVLRDQTPLRLLRCPLCKGPVSRTSHASRLPVALGEPELK